MRRRNFLIFDASYVLASSGDPELDVPITPGHPRGRGCFFVP
jgi:hypothetical protein